MKYIGDISEDGTVQAIADGAITDGATVIVNADGTVSKAVESSVSASVGSAISTESAGIRPQTWSLACGSCYDSGSDRFIFCYQDRDNNRYGTAVVATPSASSLSFGTPVVYTSVLGTVGNTPIYDSTNNKVVVIFTASDQAVGYARVGTVDPSDNSIGFGTIAAIAGGSTLMRQLNGCYDSTNSKIVLAFGYTDNQWTTSSVVGTVSGTDISFGTVAAITSANNLTYFNPSLQHDVAANKIFVAYSDSTNSNYGYGAVGTVSGTDISYSTPVVYNQSTQYWGGVVVYDSTNNRTVVLYSDYADAEKGKARVVIISGTTPSYGTEVTFEAGKTGNLAANFNPDFGKIGLGYYDESATRQRSLTGTVNASNNTIAFSEEQITGTERYRMGRMRNVTYIPTISKFIHFRILSSGGVSTYAQYIMVQQAGDITNVTAENFIGIADAAYATGQKATIKTTGSIARNVPGTLTIGQQYFVQTDGSLGTTAATPSVIAGTAIGASELIVKG